ncbi:MAG TPA: sugar phosphate nucleotidyltransferase [Steroidobacteraceae bacterium]|nr:sugar phosphate nucleotidyltransferase [Steroidobacteraceae bacterium]
MSDSDNLWALVLAAGDGRRLQGLTTTRSGLAIPKQFCSLDRGPSLLREAIGRAARIVAPERICAIVSAQHRLWWKPQLEGLEAGNVIVQPANRGTAVGMLLPLITVLERDPRARLIVLPSDHHVRDEARLSRALHRAAVPVESERAQIVLLGLEPGAADPQLGYIVPRRDGAQSHHAVERFVEKPDRVRAQELLEQGALWNMFIMAADAASLLELFERRCPGVVKAMREVIRGIHHGERSAGEALTELYAALPDLDFSRAILQGQEASLRVLPVPDCGWSDLGTPERVAEALDALPRARPDAVRAGRDVLLSLAAQSASMGRAQVAAAGGG